MPIERYRPEQIVAVNGRRPAETNRGGRDEWEVDAAGLPGRHPRLTVAGPGRFNYLAAASRALSQYERTPLIWGLLRANSQQT